MDIKLHPESSHTAKDVPVEHPPIHLHQLVDGGGSILKGGQPPLESRRDLFSLMSLKIPFYIFKNKLYKIILLKRIYVQKFLF